MLKKVAACIPVDAQLLHYMAQAFCAAALVVPFMHRRGPHWQLPRAALLQYEDVPEVELAAPHARHSSIDMGLLNRQLHGGGSATSSQRGRTKSQQLQQQSPP